MDEAGGELDEAGRMFEQVTEVCAERMRQGGRLATDACGVSFCMGAMVSVRLDLFLALSALVLAVSVGCAVVVVAYRSSRNVLVALAASNAAALPGVVFFLHVHGALLFSGSEVVGHELPSFGPARLWLPVGAGLLLWSFALAPALRIPRFVEGLRLVLGLAWLLSSCNTVTFDPAF